MSEIIDSRCWRVSMSGFTIRTGWGNEKKFIAKYPGRSVPLDNEHFTEWLDNAEKICKLYNDSLGD